MALYMIYPTDKCSFLPLAAHEQADNMMCVYQRAVKVVKCRGFEEERAVTGPSASVAVRHAGRRMAKLKFTSSLLLSARVCMSVCA